MSHLQVKNLPDSLHTELRKYVHRQGRSLRDVVIELIRRELSRDEFYRRLETRKPVVLKPQAGKILEEIRADRQDELIDENDL